MTAPGSSRGDGGDAAQRVAWFRDLIEGSGAAAGLDARLRDALRSATEGAANEIAARLQIEEQAVGEATERASRELRAAEAAERWARIAPVVYFIGGIGLLLILERVGIAASNDTLAVVVGVFGPPVFGLVGGLISWKRDPDGSYVRVGILLWIAAFVLSMVNVSL